MTRTEERNMILNALSNGAYLTKEENGTTLYQDPQYGIFFTKEQFIRTLDIIYEEMGNAYETFTQMSAEIIVTNDITKLNAQFNMSKRTIERIYGENIINKDTYEASLHNLMESYKTYFESIC